MHTQRVDPDDQRRIAHDILQDRRFHPSPAPRPLRGPLQWLGDRLRSVADGVLAFLRAFPGPTWVAIAAIVTAVVVLLVVVLARARAAPPACSAARARALDALRGEDPATLERAADDAERAGDYTEALRLRFRAGLLRLDERGAIRYRPSLTTGEVRRLLGSESFDELAARFEQVAYGGDAAEAVDVSAARDGWRRVIDAATPR